MSDGSSVRDQGAWSWSIHFGWEFLGLKSMAAIHGSLNALGFGLLGLIGLNMLAPVATSDALSTMHVGHPSRERLHRLAESARRHETTNPSGLLNRPVPAGFRSLDGIAELQPKAHAR